MDWIVLIWIWIGLSLHMDCPYNMLACSMIVEVFMLTKFIIT